MSTSTVPAPAPTQAETPASAAHHHPGNVPAYKKDTQPYLVGVPAFLIFLVFGLSGISIALFSFAFEAILDRYIGEETLPQVTIFLMKFPIFGWIGMFLMAGFLVAWWFEKMERRLGEVPRRAASLVAITGLIIVFAILTGLSLPFFDGMGASTYQ
jgi:hypothetical protein